MLGIHCRAHPCRVFPCLLLGTLSMFLLPRDVQAQSGWRFVDVTEQAGLRYQHGYKDPLGGTAVRKVAGGVAAGDYDGDGWVDLYVERGDIGPNLLLRNQGDGTFVDAAASAGVALEAFLGSGPLFFDFDGDGWLDLFVGGIEGEQPVLFHNRGDGTFEDVTAGSGIGILENAVSATAGDYDGDGRIDLFISHWGSVQEDCHLWRNLGNGRFGCSDTEAGLDLGDRGLFSFCANFADLDNDGHLDLMLTSDFGNTNAWLNDGHGGFVSMDAKVFTDENGMGSAVGDYDNDGDLDWFVTSIWDGDGVTEGDWGTTGNRLYRNRGGGTFEDATDTAGVRIGDWGWGATFADLDNDGYLDLVHVNGWPKGSDQFHEDRSPLFIADGLGHFLDRSQELGFQDTGQGRGVVCFDMDRDGDLDIFVANNAQRPSLWRNDGGNNNSYLDVSLDRSGSAAGTSGARIYVTARGETQMREVQCGSNYVSQNPGIAHFGLGDASRVEKVQVNWPDGAVSIRTDVGTNRVLEMEGPVSDAGLPEGVRIVALPNPFHAQTNIMLTGGMQSPIRVYDVSGRLVQVLKPLGWNGTTTTYRWNGRDRLGRSVRDGIYLLQAARGAPALRIALMH